MANYFSNHSQSRFLANSGASGNQTTNNTNGGVPQGGTIQQQQQGSAAAVTGAQRSRLPSKHFSTSVSTSVSAERSKESSPSTSMANGSVAVHPLRNTWVFWFRQQRAPGNKITNYEEGIKKISSFSSVETFWSLWTHLSPPSGLQPTTDYLLFHAGIRRPVWEDPLNITGGKWIIRLRKGVADRIWEDLVMAIIGDQFDECRPANGSNLNGASGDGAVANGVDGEDKGEEWPEICGCTISVRQSEDIVSLWNRVEVDQKNRDKIRDTLRRVLGLPQNTIMEYKSNNDSMQDKSSFRNSAIDRSNLTPS